MTDDRLENGCDEAALFAYLDGDLGALALRFFEAHLDGCPACRRDAEAYRSLYRALDGLEALAARPGFDARVLEAVLPMPAPASSRPAGFLERLLGRALPGLGGPIRAWAGAALVMALIVLTVLTMYARSLGGPRELASRTAVQATQVGADVVTGGVDQVLAAIEISDIMLRVAVLLRPLWRSMSLAFNAVDAEFWVVSTLVSFLALLGAVRLAGGSAVERGVRRVCLLV